MKKGWKKFQKGLFEDESGDFMTIVKELANTKRKDFVKTNNLYKTRRNGLHLDHTAIDELHKTTKKADRISPPKDRHCKRLHSQSFNKT